MRAGTLIRGIVKGAQYAAIGVSAYHAAVTVFGSLRPDPVRRAPESLPRFAILVAARNEAEVIGDLIRDVQAQDYPPELVDIVVVAHNCSDATYHVARDLGVRVLELRTPFSGKALAMRSGLEAVAPDADFVGIFDADARIRSDLLSSIAAEAGDDAAVQVETRAARSPSVLATSYGVGRVARNVLWWRPRARLGLGATISGGGFFVRPEIARPLLQSTRTITEDLELTAMLAAEGRRVRFAWSSPVEVDEPEALSQSLRQRARWARGHLATIRRCWPGVARRALRGDRVAADLAIYLLVPTRVITWAAVGNAALLRLFSRRWGVNPWVLATAVLAETLIPLVFAMRTRIVPANTRGVAIALEHAFLGVLWFPVGLWALVTARASTWRQSPRQSRAAAQRDEPAVEFPSGVAAGGGR